MNADKEKELCTMFNVVALPTLFFIPVGGKPIIDVGAQPEKHEQIIKEQLLKSNDLKSLIKAIFHVRGCLFGLMRPDGNMI